jgi:hypothetical protein
MWICSWPGRSHVHWIRLVLGKLLVPLLLLFVICDTTIIELWLCCVPAIKPVTLCVNLAVLSSHGCMVFWPSTR